MYSPGRRHAFTSASWGASLRGVVRHYASSSFSWGLQSSPQQVATYPMLPKLIPQRLDTGWCVKRDTSGDPWINPACTAGQYRGDSWNTIAGWKIWYASNTVTHQFANSPCHPHAGDRCHGTTTNLAASCQALCLQTPNCYVVTTWEGTFCQTVATGTTPSAWDRCSHGGYNIYTSNCVDCLPGDFLPTIQQVRLRF